MIRSSFAPLLFVFCSVFPAAALSPARYQACQGLNEELRQQQVRLVDLQESYQVLAAEVEAAGEVWEAAETLRDFSPDHELAADETKLAYDELRVTFFETQGVLATQVDTYNRDASEFNETCNN